MLHPYGRGGRALHSLILGWRSSLTWLNHDH
jgi:hypothetical protein